MFIVLVTYRKELEMVDQYLAAHRSYLDEGYKKNFLIASGPRNPRVGGVLLSQLNNRDQLEAYLKNDPFCLHEIADYDVIEFTPVKYHQEFLRFIL